MQADYKIARITSVEVLVAKISKEKNAHIQKALKGYLQDSEKYAQMMMTKYNHPASDYWHLKCLYVYNKVFPSLRHDYSKPNKIYSEEDAKLFELYTYENSQCHGISYDEYSFRYLEEYAATLN